MDQSAPPPPPAAVSKSTQTYGSPGRHRSPSRRLLLPGALALILIGITLIVVQPLWHQPAPTAQPTLPASVRISGTAPELPWPAVGQAAVSVDGLGALGSHGDPTPVPIGSVAKVMTAYVVLTEHPLGVGEPGPSLTVSAAAGRRLPTGIGGRRVPDPGRRRGEVHRT